MGEAKRRRESRERTGPIPIDLRDDVASAVRAMTLIPTAGGYCVAINQLGYVVLTACGLEPFMAMGSMIYRVGSDPVRDVVCFSGPGGAGCMRGPILLGHLWIEMDGDIIDFSAGDWKKTATALCVYADSGALDDTLLHEEKSLGAIQFDVEPPEYIWQPAAPLKAAWQRDANPEVGAMCYGPWAGERISMPTHDLVRYMVPRAKHVMCQLHIPERIKAWRNGCQS